MPGHREQKFWASHWALLGYCICLSLLHLATLLWTDATQVLNTGMPLIQVMSCPQLRPMYAAPSRLYVLHLGCGPIEKHELRIGKLKARDQEADYWLQIAAQSWTVRSHMHTNTWCQLSVRWLEAWAQSWGWPHLWKCGGGCFSTQMNSVLIISQLFFYWQHFRI